MNLTRRLLMSGALAAGIVLALLGSMGASASSAVFKNPGAIALDHQGHLWVANSDYFGITEIRASTGKVIRVINAKADGFIDPSGIAVSGNDVWVVNGGVTRRNRDRTQRHDGCLGADSESQEPRDHGAIGRQC